jgi:hypothetical protein
MNPLSSTRRRFRPGIEALEGRCVPATMSVVGSTMTIVGDSRDEIIDITDNGDGDLTVLCGSAAEVAAGHGTIRSVANITAINVTTRGGNDVVHYFQTGDRTRSMTINARLGDGRDVFFADLEGDIDNTRLTMNVHGGDQGDAITVDASADVDIGAFGALLLSLDGGNWSLGRDLITVDYRGEIDGLLMFAESGRGGRDDLVARVHVDSGSSGVFAGVQNAGQGGDRLLFHIEEESPDDPFSIAVAVARGGGGDDRWDLTPQVSKRNI